MLYLKSFSLSSHGFANYFFCFCCCLLLPVCPTTSNSPATAFYNYPGSRSCSRFFFENKSINLFNSLRPLFSQTLSPVGPHTSFPVSLSLIMELFIYFFLGVGVGWTCAARRIMPCQVSIRAASVHFDPRFYSFLSPGSAHWFNGRIGKPE